MKNLFLLSAKIRIPAFTGKLTLTAIFVLAVVSCVGAQTGTSPIEITEFSFTPTTIHTTNSSQAVTVTIRVTDTQRDVSAINVSFISPVFQNPGGNQNQHVYLFLNGTNRISGNGRDGVYRKDVIFPQYIKAGTWKVNHIHVNDGLNNRSFSISELAARGFNTQLQVISNNEDTVSPEISDFNFTPTAVDTTNGSQNITITLRARDAISGISSIYVGFYHPTIDYYDFGDGYYETILTGANRISGDDKDGVYRIVLTIPQNAFSGIYGVVVYAPDAVGNYRSLGPANLAARGYPAQLQIRSALNLAKTMPFDFDDDDKADVSIFRPALGEWWYLRSSDGGNRAFQFGVSTDKMIPADYTGDGKTDIALFRPSTGAWFVLRSEDNSYYSFGFGNATDIPIPADYDADGLADPAIFRPSTREWYINYSTGYYQIQEFGAAGDVPVVADYDGDQRADIAIFRPSVSEWWIERSSLGLIAFQFGQAGDKPVPADYTGEGRTDAAFFRPSTGFWYVLRSEDFSFYAAPFGANGDIPTPADYDGDGKADFAVFRPSEQKWYQSRSQAGFQIVQFGIPNDKPVPAAYLP